jgi:hypothetical protein
MFSPGSTRFSLATAVLGALIVLGAIANFNFMLGVAKTAMLISGAIVLAAGCIGLALTMRGAQPRFSLAIAVFGALIALGAIANFNFMFGVAKTAMLISGAIVLAAGCVGLALTMRGAQPRPSAAAVPPAPPAAALEAIRRDVKGPAIGLLVTAILNWILIPLALLVLVPAAQSSVPGARPFLPIPLLVITPLVLCTFIVYAALKMMRLEARGAALVASVLAILVAPGNIIGLSLGVWALVVLCRREVRAAFAGDKTALASVLHTPARSHAVWPWVVATVMVAVGMLLLIPVVMITVPALARQSPRAEAVRRGRQAAEQAHSAAAQNQFRARMRQGEVELVGLSFHPSTNQPWWRPDGAPCREGPFGLRSHFSSPLEWMTREFVVRLTGLPADASGPVWKFDPPGGWAGGEVYVGEQPAPDLRGVSASLPKSASAVTVKVGIGMGAWEMVARQVPGGSSITGVGRQGSNWVVSFPKAESAEGGARILVVHTVKDWETRVLAVDKDGQEHPAPSSESSGTDAFTQITAKFPGLPLERVKEFQLQVRPYQWAEFQGVALYPKQPLAGRGVVTFGPTINRVIQSGETGTNLFLNLDTGQLLTPPEAMGALFKEEYLKRLSWEKASDPRAKRMREWLRTSGANLMVSGGQLWLARLEMREGVAINPPWTGTGRVGFDQTDPHVVAQQAEVFLKPLPTDNSIKIRLVQPGFDAQSNTRLDTFLFRTQEGTVGVLQILNTEDRPRGVRIRYKLVQTPSSAPASGFDGGPGGGMGVMQFRPYEYAL